MVEQLKSVVIVGRTHWKGERPRFEIDKSKMELFFAPTLMQKRYKEWGEAKYDEITSSFLKRSFTKTESWLSYKELNGLEDLATIFADISNGHLKPDEGIIVKMG